MKKFGFGDNFITWIKILLNDQQSCVINGRFATQHFTLTKGARQGDPISAYLFIIALEVLFTLIKSKDNINGVDLYDYYFYLLLMKMTRPFFLKDIASFRILVDTFKVFSCFSGLKPNINMCEIDSLGILKGTQEAVCDLQNIDLTNDSIKILGIHFSYNKKIQTERNYLTTVKKIQKAFNVWITRKLTLEGKMLIFKILGIFKIVYLPLIINLSNSIHSNLSFNLAFVDSFPEFYKQIFINWSSYFVSNSEVSSCIQFNFLWYNKHILIDNKPVYLSSFHDKNINFINN